MTDYIVKDGISNYRDSYRKQYLFNNANPGCNIHVTIHVYIHISVYEQVSVQRGSQKLTVAGSGCSSISWGYPYGWISIPETRLDSIEYSFPVALTDGSHFVNIVDGLTCRR